MRDCAYCGQQFKTLTWLRCHECPNRPSEGSAESSGGPYLRCPECQMLSPVEHVDGTVIEGEWMWWCPVDSCQQKTPMPVTDHIFETGDGPSRAE
jgi:DNA-directed RNA polymerase subunit RPC12/RpoP